MTMVRISAAAALLVAVAGTAAAQDSQAWDRGDFMQMCMKSATDAKIDYSRGEAICSCTAAKVEGRIAQARADGSTVAAAASMPADDNLTEIMRDCTRR